jgi:hypothetical protein
MPASRPPRSGIAFRGIPRDRTVLARIGPKGVPILRWPGEMELLAPTDPVLLRAWPQMIHDPALPFALPRRVDAVLNLCASAEHYPLSLAALDAALGPGIAVLNHPRAVMWTRRDLAFQVLAQVSFLRVRKVRRFLPRTPRDVMATFEAGGFSYPVALEPAAAEEGMERHEIAHPGEWTRLFHAPWSGRVWIMTQQSLGQGPWRMRIGLAGKDAHSETYRVDAASGGAPPALPVDRLRAVVKAVRQCIPLDIATLVLALDPDGPVVERIDAGLPVPMTDASPAFIGRSSHRIRAALAAPLSALLRDTALWRTDAARLPAIPAAATEPHPEGA